MKSITTLILIFLSSLCLAQQKYKAWRQTETHTNPSWYLVERHNLPPLFSTYLILSESDVESTRFITGEEGKKAFKGKGMSAGPSVKIKPSAKLLSLDELLKIYKVKAKNLTIVVDGLDVYFPDLLYASKSAVQFVKISDHHRIKEIVIYIRTFRPLPNPNDY